MPRKPPIKNPLIHRLNFVKQQYEHRPDVYRIVSKIVKEAAGVTDIEPDDRRAWERNIGVLAQLVGREEKRFRKGQISKEEFSDALEDLRARFLEEADTYSEGATPQKIKKIKRQRETVNVGAKKVADLRGGYIAVQAMPNLKAPPFPYPEIAKLSDREAPKQKREAQKRWVEENARFQQWLGTTMKNCLQIYRVNFAAYGLSKFDSMRKGAKLYAILDSADNPVVATTVTKCNRIIESNGPGNMPPGGAAKKVEDEFIKNFGFKGLKARLDVPFVDESIKSLFEYFIDFWPEEDLDNRDQWADAVRLAVTQDGFDPDLAIRSFLVYILTESEYSALNSIRRTNHQDKIKVEQIVITVSKLIDSNASERELNAASRAADAAHGAHGAAAYDAAAYDADASDAARNAAINNAHAASAASRAASRAAVAVAFTVAYAAAAAHAAAAAAHAAGSASRAASRAAAYDAAYAAAGASARADYAKGFLKILQESAGVRRQNPRKNNARAAKASPAQALITECRRLWDHYCERPNKTRLRAVIKHCEKMAESTAKSAKEERARCMRSARREMKKY